MKVGTEDTDLFKFTQRITSTCALAARCSELGIQKFCVKLSNRSSKPSPEFPQGRTFAVDTHEQWELVLPQIIKGERELIGNSL